MERFPSVFSWLRLDPLMTTEKFLQGLIFPLTSFFGFWAILCLFLNSFQMFFWFAFFFLCNIAYSKYHRFLSQEFLLFPLVRFFFSFWQSFCCSQSSTKSSFSDFQSNHHQRNFFVSSFPILIFYTHENWKMLSFNPAIRKKGSARAEITSCKSL